MSDIDEDIDELRKMGIYCSDPKELQSCLDALDIQMLIHEDEVLRGLVTLYEAEKSNESLLIKLKAKYEPPFGRLLPRINEEVNLVNFNPFGGNDRHIPLDAIEHILDSVPSVFSYFFTSNKGKNETPEQKERAAQIFANRWSEWGAIEKVIEVGSNYLAFTYDLSKPLKWNFHDQ